MLFRHTEHDIVIREETGSIRQRRVDHYLRGERSRGQRRKGRTTRKTFDNIPARAQLLKQRD